MDRETAQHPHGAGKPRRRPATRLLGSLCLLIALTALAGLPDVRWQSIDRHLTRLDVDAAAIRFVTRGTASRDNAQGDTLTLQSNADTPSRAWYLLPLGEHRSTKLRVRARIAQLADGDIPHPRPAWWSIRLLDAAGEPVQRASLQHFSQGTDWQTDRIIDVPATAVTVQVLAHVRPGGAAFRLSGMSIAYVATAPHYRLMIGVLVCAAAALLVLVLRHIGRQTGARGVAVGAVLFLLIVSGITLPTGELAAHAGGTAASHWLLATLPPMLTGGSILQFGHFLGFLGLALLVCATRRRLGLAGYEAVLLVVLLAVGSEVVQLHTPARSMELTDLLRDLGGAAIVLVLCIVYNQISMISGTETSRIKASSGNPRRQ